MKDIEWITGNKMRFESLHKTFNRQIKAIMTGNVIGGGQYSSFIRARTKTECNSMTFPVGHLRECDLKYFKLTRSERDIIESETESKDGILYEFRHYDYARRRYVVHGFIFTRTDYLLVTKLYRGGPKSMSVISNAAPYISNPPGEGDNAVGSVKTTGAAHA